MRRISVRDAAGNISGQVIGAVIAAALLFGVASPVPGGYDASKLGFGTNGYGSRSPTGYHISGVLNVGIVLTALLVFTVLACTDAIAVIGFAAPDGSRRCGAAGPALSTDYPPPGEGPPTATLRSRWLSAASTLTM